MSVPDKETVVRVKLVAVNPISSGGEKEKRNRVGWWAPSPQRGEELTQRLGNSSVAQGVIAAHHHVSHRRRSRVAQLEENRVGLDASDDAAHFVGTLPAYVCGANKEDFVAVLQIPQIAHRLRHGRRGG